VVGGVEVARAPDKQDQRELNAVARPFPLHRVALRVLLRPQGKAEVEEAARRLHRFRPE
jgi:hypothetical protein